MYLSGGLIKLRHVLSVGERCVVVLFKSANNSCYHKTLCSMEIQTVIQTYDWGKRGNDSLVAKLYKNVNRDFQIENATPYAELWMGTHPNGPSIVRETGQLLSAFIAENPECLGKDVRRVFGAQLPYLFKVLSINNALSIQVHPGKVMIAFR